MISRDAKRELKSAVMQALHGKLPITIGNYRMEAAMTAISTDPFLNIKVKDLNGNLETYLEVRIKETF